MISTELHGRSIIASTLVEPKGDDFCAISPLTSEALPTVFHQCDESDVDRAVTLANEAFAIYRKVSGAERATFLEAIAEEIMELGDTLLDRAHRETGLPLDRLKGERGRTCGQLKLFAEVVREGSWCDARIDTAQPDRQPLPKADIRRMLQPIGPVIVFGSSNFPLAFSVAGGDTASAFAAGCTVVVKAHSAHPGTSELVASAINRAIAKCQLPAGVFSMLHGAGAKIGVALVKHAQARAAGFTGSRAAGRALFDAAASRPEPIPVFAEMSSLNPVLVFPGAVAERGPQIVEGLRTSVTMGVGQFCTKPGLVFGLAGPSFEQFVTDFGQAVSKVAPGTMLHAGIRDSYDRGLDTVAMTAGVTAVGESADEADEKRTQGEAAAFVTDAETFLQNRELHEEVFGPCTLLISTRSLAELGTLVNSLEGQLTATIHATDDELAAASDLIALLERKVGRLVFNGFPTGVEVCPSMNHGGPYPATTDVRFTSVGTAAILRWARPVCYQAWPAAALPPELQNGNPLGTMRLVNGSLTRDAVL